MTEAPYALRQIEPRNALASFPIKQTRIIYSSNERIRSIYTIAEII